MAGNQEGLFPNCDTARYGDNRRLRSLFIPALLRQGTWEFRQKAPPHGEAFEILSRWAQLDASGKLLRRKETALEAEFLTQVFGQALGYTLWSKSAAEWNLEQKFNVNGGEADAALGLFQHGRKCVPAAVIELKGPRVNLDRDRFNGRTPVQQCWDYLNALPACPWGIVSNFVSFRLYHRQHTPKVYQLFTLRDLSSREEFEKFFFLLGFGGLFPPDARTRPRAEALLAASSERQKEVGDELYNEYSSSRWELIQHLTHHPHDMSREKAIRVAQRLIDRIVFIAFCEDRGLLPDKSIDMAHSQIPPFALATNPRWQNFRQLFKSVDQGNRERGINKFNGGLFEHDPDVDDLELSDDWTGFFSKVGSYDFKDEVNVDVLGHLFEKSVHDIEELRVGGLFGEVIAAQERPKMVKSAERKRHGIYYTPKEFTDFITENTVGKVIDERIAGLAQRHGVELGNASDSEPSAKRGCFWRECLEAVKEIKVVDPACGSGAFLISAYEVFEDRYKEIVDHIDFHDGNKNDTLSDQIPDLILRHNLYGVDLSDEAVEISRLSLWIRSARERKTLADLSDNIICGNSLVDDPTVHPKAMGWRDTFPDVFGREQGGFDCVIGNPPWERMKLQEREYFDRLSPAIASAVNAAERRRLIEQLEKSDLDLHQRYAEAKEAAERTLSYVRQCDRYPLTGKGDINTYAVFAELAYSIVASQGRIGLLVPSGIATDQTTSEFFANLVSTKRLTAIYDFENKLGLFPDVHRSFKFSVMLVGGHGTKSESFDFVFFARQIQDLNDKNRHVKLSAADIKLVNPNTLTCPIFRTKRDAELTKAVYHRVPVLVDHNRKEGGNPWGVRFVRMFDQTNDAELFLTAEQLKKDSFRRYGAVWKKGKQVFLPLYEAKMIQIYDHRAASVEVKDKNWMRQGQTVATMSVQHQNPEFTVEPRWWVQSQEVTSGIDAHRTPAFLAYKDVTSPTNQRTMIASFIPFVGVLNSAPLVFVDGDMSVSLQSCLLANFNALPYDFAVRQKIGGIHLNFFVVEQGPMFAPDFYSARCQWDQRQALEKWISDRVLKLTCTSNDMIPLAEAAGFDPPVHKWKPDERAVLMAELDAAYFLLYGIEREDVEYILSTFSGIEEQPEGFFEAGGTRALILKQYDRLREKSS